MYEKYWKLSARPFENTADTRYYYPSEAHQGALLKLRYAIENRRGAALLAGQAGLGKTLLVQTLIKQLGAPQRPVVHLVFPQMPAQHLLAFLTDELTGSRTASAGDVHLTVQRLQQSLAENVRAGRHALVIVDEAHVLTAPDSLEMLRLLLNFEFDSQPGLTLLLVGQPSLFPVLDRMPELDERLSVKCLLRPFGVDENSSYINHRLRAAGAEQAIFDDAAIEAIHHHSQGIPRRVNRLCDLALLIGFAEERTMIGAAQIDSITEELVTVAPE